ncbi:hypothetical protein U1Q18_009313 [Sarracenia purpurea var. burkii]
MDAGIPLNPYLLSHKVVAIAAGKVHILALTGDGNVLAWGRGTLGQLHMGLEKDQHLPFQIDFDFAGKSLEGKRLKFVEVAAGAYHSFALAVTRKASHVRPPTTAASIAENV